MKAKSTLDPLPPRLANKLFEWWCKNASVEDLHGDVEELFHCDLKIMSPNRAKIKYWKHVASVMFSYALKKRKQKSASHPYSYPSIHPVMLKNHFKIAWRTISKNKVYSAINVLGLALGICACLTIYLITDHEFSFDTFHPDKERIYRIVGESGKGEDKWMFNCVPAPAPGAIREEITGFEVVTGFHRFEPRVSIPDGDKPPKKFERSDGAAIVAEPDYFSLFSYEWLSGSPLSLKDPFKVVLSERKARTYFGSLPWDQIIGKEVVYDDSLRVTVSGIVKDWNRNTDFPFTDFISFASIQHSYLKNDIRLDDWYSSRHSSQGFVKVKAGTSPLALSKPLTALFRKYQREGGPSTPVVKLQPLSEIHFYPNDEQFSSTLPTLYTLMGLALFILIIAAINFINLSTAQSIRRSKEIGIRKVLGSLRLSLVVQFLVETFVLTSVAVVIASLLVRPVLWWFDSFIPRGLSLDPFDPITLSFLLVITISTSLLAGLYPAKVLSAYLPALTLKGTGTKMGSDNWLVRKGLIVFQFAISLFFIIGALVMGNQIRFIKTKDRGFTTESVVTFRTNWSDKSKNPSILADRIRLLNGVEGVALEVAPPMGFAQITNNIVYKGIHLIETSVNLKAAGPDFIPLYRIPLLAGRNIAQSDSLKEFVINETYSKQLGFLKPEEALGQFLYFNNKPYPIVGVVGDFHERSFHDPIGPSVIGTFTEFLHDIAIKLSPNTTQEGLKPLLTQVEKLYKQIYPDEAFQSHFIEDEIGWMHEGEQKTANVMNAAMVVTIFISCMGVFGLAMYTAETRTREIGIRKVLGATVVNITTMLSKEFAILIGIAIVIASPVAWYFMNDWLMKFAYRVDLTAWVFVLSGLAALSMGLLTVSFQTIKAAVANPVDSLRAE